MTLSTESELHERAWHEAGHTIVGTAIGREFERVSIVVQGESGGRCQEKQLQPPDEYLDDVQLYLRWFDDITIQVAGPLAQARERGGSLDRLGASKDLQDASGLAYRLVRENLPTDTPVSSTQVKKTGEQVLEKAIARADRLLNARRTLLRALAQALHERTELSGNDVSEIIRAHGP
jgi:ATP-dependent Zn protease